VKEGMRQTKIGDKPAAIDKKQAIKKASYLDSWLFKFFSIT